MSKWAVEYDNDVGPNDEGFWEWWEVTDCKTTYKTDDKAAAERLCALLNEATPASTGAEPTHHPVFAFLLGEGELDGCRFGERPKHGVEEFWWRRHLRDALVTQLLRGHNE